MSKILTNNQYYHQIADVIREQNGTSNTYKPQQIVTALKDLFYEEVEGVPPITFQGIGENLLDYRIDGVGGGVGERTKNLFSSTIVNDYHLDQTTGLPSYKVYRCATINPILINNNSLILQYKSEVENTLFMYSLFSDNTLIRRVAGNVSGATIDTTGANKIYFSFYKLNETVTSNNLSEIMLSENNIVYEPYGYKVPVVVSGKNLLQNNAATQTINGVTFTVNDDGSVTCNGTANETVKHMLGRIDLMSGVQYKMSGCPTNGANNTYRLDPRLTTGSVVVSFIDNGNGAVYTPNADVRINVYIYIQNGYTCDNLTFYPMIRLTTIEDDTYEPYHEPTTTNIYLDKPIKENESISLSDTNVNIPTIRGTNVLTVDTTVQPSKVYIKSRHESSYETAMREDYEEQLSDIESALQEV